jgi:hypothetical protein
LDAAQALETVANFLGEALANTQGGGNHNGKNGCSFKEFDEYQFLKFEGIEPEPQKSRELVYGHRRVAHDQSYELYKIAKSQAHRLQVFQGRKVMMVRRPRGTH